MKAPKPPRNTSGMNMTPMIDVVFQLIIFFLVASHFTNQENAVEVDLPTATDAQEVKNDETPRFTLSIPREGELFLGIKSIAGTDLKELFQKEKKHQKDAFQLRVRVGRSVPYSEVEPVLLAAAESGIFDVQFAVLEE